MIASGGPVIAHNGTFMRLEDMVARCTRCGKSGVFAAGRAADGMRPPK
jgi:hypothetical protein